jgi:putative transposase
MPRANRFYLPGVVWHITHRCHNRSFLLSFERDRGRWKHWLFQARKRYDLCVLDYIATSNHVHLLVKDRGGGEIARSMQLVAGRTAQEYNRRKSRRGAFWEDRYFATAVATDRHLVRCLVYIDLNMVRAGVVNYPAEWKVSGFREIQSPPDRYRIIDRLSLCALTNQPDDASLREAHKYWVESSLCEKVPQREPIWTESVAVGSTNFVGDIRTLLGAKAYHRPVRREDEETSCIEDST